VHRLSTSKVFLKISGAACLDLEEKEEILHIGLKRGDSEEGGPVGELRWSLSPLKSGERSGRKGGIFIKKAGGKYQPYYEGENLRRGGKRDN